MSVSSSSFTRRPTSPLASFAAWAPEERRPAANVCVLVEEEEEAAVSCQTNSSP